MNLFHAKRLMGVALMVEVIAFAQQPKPPSGRTSRPSQPKFKAIWEPVNVKHDVELTSVAFTSPEEGWVAGGRNAVAGGIILHQGRRRTLGRSDRRSAIQRSRIPLSPIPCAYAWLGCAERRNRRS